MPEVASEVFYASAKPEAVKKPNPVVKKVQDVFTKWLDRVGPNDIEKHFVEAHQKVLNSFTNEERRSAYEKTLPRWKTAGKIVGWGATAIDTALAGFGLFVTIREWQRPDVIRNELQSSIAIRNLRMEGNIHSSNFIIRQLENSYKLLYGQDITKLHDGPTARDMNVARGLTAATGAVSLVPIIGSGPAHWMSHLVADVAAGIRIPGVQILNYIDSGKAAEHAKKVGNAVGKGLTSTINYAAQHTDQISNLVETAQRVKHTEEMHKRTVASLNAEEARMKLEQGYNDWKNSMAPSLKAFYTMSNSWPPPIDEYKQVLAEQEKAKKQKK